MSDAGESSDDGDGDRVEFLYTGQEREEIPWDVTHVRVDPSVKRIGDDAFKEYELLEELELGEGLEEIGESAFEACTSLKRVRIPSTVKRIGRWSFEECDLLEEVELCEGLEEIGFRAFAGCKSLKRVRIPPTIKGIDEYAFYCCEQLEEVDLCEDIEEIGKCTFAGCKSLKRIRTPPTAKRIGDYAFDDCKQLEEVELCEGLEEIGDGAFDSCRSLKRVRLPSTVRKIGKRAFEKCQQLEGVELCEGLEKIGYGAFEDCFSLRNISIPSSLKIIGACALRGCDDIRKLFGSQNIALDALRCRLEGLPAHRICYHQSGQPAHLIFEQLQNIFDMKSDQVKKSIPAASSLAHKKMNKKRAATSSVSSRKLKARCRGVGGSATASGASNFAIEIPHEIDGSQDCLGMTPLHILACSTKQNLDLYQLIIANQPNCLITKDRWGCLPIFYAIRGSCPPEILQFLIDSQKSDFPDINLNWDTMISTLCRAGASLNLVQRLLKIKQASFPVESINFQRAAQELTVNCLVGCDPHEDFPSRWEFMMEVFSEYRAQQGLVESLLEIQQSFFPDRSPTRWQALCEELVKPLKNWWNPESTVVSFSMFQFLARCSIPERLHAIGVRKWQKDIECLVERNISRLRLSNHTDTIHSMMVFYECEYPQLKERAYLIELALWKSKMEELMTVQHKNAGPRDTADELTSDMKAQYRVNCGAEIIIPNVLLYLIVDASEENLIGAGYMDQSSSSGDDTSDVSNNEDDNGSGSSDDSDDEV